MLEPIMTNVFWFDAKTDLPTVEGDYLVAIGHNDIVPGPVGYITTMHFFEKSRTFNSHDGKDRTVHNRIFAWAHKIRCFNEIYDAVTGRGRANATV